MSEEVVVTPDAALINHYCPICASIMYRSVWEGMPGWQCPDPDCGFFEID